MFQQEDESEKGVKGSLGTVRVSMGKAHRHRETIPPIMKAS